MDFFSHQESARRRSGFLVFLFAVAIAAIIGSTYFSLCVLSPITQQVSRVVGADGNQSNASLPQEIGQILLWQPKLLFIAIAGTLVIILSGSLYKTAELRGGGRVVATALGGELISHASPNPSERQLLNVVEEMSIASGIPVPPVYVLKDEPGINAFAAGYSINDAVIGVSRGAIDALTRDQIQGVIAHEYSHILNGDMRINIRLMGLLHGILLIALIGFYLIRITAYSGTGSRGKNNPAIYLLFLGFAVVVIGSIGLLFGRLIKASLSRQREYLADASAVQFTRNPDGIAGALKKIAQLTYGSRIQNPEAESVSHMFFGNGRRGSFVNLFSTHPPLNERIKRLDPLFKEQHQHNVYQKGIRADNGRDSVVQSLAEANAPTKGAAENEAPPTQAAGNIAPPATTTTSSAVTQTSIESSSTQLPAAMLTAAHEPYSARSVVFSVLLSPDASVRATQLTIIKKQHGTAVYKSTRGFYPEISTTDRYTKLCALDVCHPALSELSPSQRDELSATVKLLIEADQQIDLFEFMAQRVITTRVDHSSAEVSSANKRYGSYRPYKDSISIILAAISYASGLDNQLCLQQYHQTMFSFFPNGSKVKMPARAHLSLNEVSGAMDHVSKSSLKVKHQLITAAISCVSIDNKTTINELQLIRALSATLNVAAPALPPLSKQND
jgi:Zn-dependent protease with chaperone function